MNRVANLCSSSHMLGPKVMNLGGFFSNSNIENLRSNTRVSKNSGSIGSDGEQQQPHQRRNWGVYYQTYFIGKKAGETFFLKLIYKKIDVNQRMLNTVLATWWLWHKLYIFKNTEIFKKKRNFFQRAFFCEGKWKIFSNVLDYSFWKWNLHNYLINYLADMCQSH